MTTATMHRLESNTSADKVRKVRVTDVYDRIEMSRKPFIVSIGGAGSSKSYSIAQLLVRRLMNRPFRKILVTRKTGPALFLTAYSLIVNLLKDYGYYPSLHHEKTRSIITNLRNGAMIAFMSIDDPEKIKSTDWNDVWMEEADEFSWNDFLILQTRMRAPIDDEGPNQIIMSLNPGQEQGFINQKIILSPAFDGKVDTFWSTYRDNPFLSKEYIDTLESLKDQDPEAHRIYADGKFGALTNIIYKPFIVMQKFPEAMDEEFFCADFGFNNPSAILRIGTRDLTNHYITQLIYRTRLTNSQLIDLAKELIPESDRDLPMYCDAAEPQRIQEFCNAGFNALPADKDVKSGIDFCKRQTFYTLESNSETNKESKSYKWRIDKNGNVLDEPVKFMDHAMDSMRYGCYTHYKDMLSGDQVKISSV